MNGRARFLVVAPLLLVASACTSLKEGSVVDGGAGSGGKGGTGSVGSGGTGFGGAFGGNGGGGTSGEPGAAGVGGSSGAGGTGGAGGSPGGTGGGAVGGNSGAAGTTSAGGNSGAAGTSSAGGSSGAAGTSGVAGSSGAAGTSSLGGSSGGASGAPGSAGSSSAGSAGVAGAAGGAGGIGGGSGGGPPTVDYAGSWVGTTSQGLLLRFTVFANAILRVESNWIVQVPSTGCVASGGTATTFGTPVPIETDGTFGKGPVGGDPITFTVNGTFTSARQASGNIQLTHAKPNCTGTVNLTWTAVKVVCGDGRLDWSETCDDRNSTAGDGCSEICQLTASREVEPNNVIDTAATPITSDAYVGGSITPGTEADVFPVKNNYPGPIAISFETFGDTPGSCTIDTYVELLDSGGTVLASDDDGSRALFCSALTYSVPSGATIYVRVTSFRQTVIGNYGLFVKFQMN